MLLPPIDFEAKSNKINQSLPSVHSSLEMLTTPNLSEANRLAAVPHAINSGCKYLVFRPYLSSLNDRASEIKPIEKGFNYKIISNNDLKLVRTTLEDNGFTK